MLIQVVCNQPELRASYQRYSLVAATSTLCTQHLNLYPDEAFRVYVNKVKQYDN